MEIPFPPSAPYPAVNYHARFSSSRRHEIQFSTHKIQISLTTNNEPSSLNEINDKIKKLLHSTSLYLALKQRRANRSSFFAFNAKKILLCRKKRIIVIRLFINIIKTPWPSEQKKILHKAKTPNL
jgi:hypothetical protein